METCFNGTGIFAIPVNFTEESFAQVGSGVGPSASLPNVKAEVWARVVCVLVLAALRTYISLRAAASICQGAVPALYTVRHMTHAVRNPDRDHSLGLP
ncbi:unnamed protein product [Pieris brassicae]|uniref:Uncharacterized protein n=1 Tax=Pieris brassicae TaxID=7116 RepID=A0A9P0XCA2_PIEBR|nr:unnamed protein product [Pieris brassicae]